MLARALDEQRSHLAEHSADQRQTRKLRFRDEAHRMDRVQDEDIEPGHVVRDQQRLVVDV